MQPGGLGCSWRACLYCAAARGAPARCGHASACPRFCPPLMLHMQAIASLRSGTMRQKGCTLPAPPHGSCLAQRRRGSQRQAGGRRGLGKNGRRLACSAARTVHGGAAGRQRAPAPPRVCPSCARREAHAAVQHLARVLPGPAAASCCCLRQAHSTKTMCPLLLPCVCNRRRTRLPRTWSKSP